MAYLIPTFSVGLVQGGEGHVAVNVPAVTDPVGDRWREKERRNVNASGNGTESESVKGNVKESVNESERENETE